MLVSTIAMGFALAAGDDSEDGSDALGGVLG
jgi:hypothetical protein